jgi:hypothetical protein
VEVVEEKRKPKERKKCVSLVGKKKKRIYDCGYFLNQER